MNQLLLGCGHDKRKKLGWPMPKWEREWDTLFTLDFNADVGPDLLCDLDHMAWMAQALTVHGGLAIDEPSSLNSSGRLRDNFFHEIHAYEVLEHLGSQGNFRTFFDTFSNLYRLLVDGGLVIATCPSRYSGWLWGDPGHTRAIIPECLSFLDQTIYAKECGKTTRSDYRFAWKGDFETLICHDDKATHAFILKAHKPAR